MFVSIRSVPLNAAAEGSGGSAEQAPAQSTEAAPEAPPARESAESKKRRTVADLKAMFARQQSGQPAAPSEPAAPAQANAAAVAAAPTVEAAETAEAIADAGAKVPEQREGESDKKYELRLAKALQDVRELETVGKRERAGREAAEKKAAEFERRIARAKDPEAVLEAIEELTGLSYEALTRGIVEGKIKPRGASAQLPPELRKQLEEQQAELTRLKQIEDARAQERAQAEQIQQFEAHTNQAKAYLEQHAEDYPILAASDWAAPDLVRRAYARKTPNLDVLARELDHDAGKNILRVVADERGLKSLLKREPALKAKIVAALGLNAAPPKQAAPASTEASPRSVSRVPTEASTPPDRSKLPRDELKRMAVKSLRDMRG